MAMVLVAIGFSEKDRPLLAGIFWGLALGLKTTAAVPLLVWLGWGMGRGRMKKTVAAAVLWAVQGDAGQRALAAWSMGWSPAQTASGKDWLRYKNGGRYPVCGNRGSRGKG